jgi:hypothetical protein
MSDMFDALISDQPVDTADLANRLRKKEALGTLAALTGISGLQKLGPQMVEDAGKGAQDYATLRDRSANQKLQRLQAYQAEQDRKDAAAATLEDRKRHDKEYFQNRLDTAALAGAATAERSKEAAVTKAATVVDKQQNQYDALAATVDNATSAIRRLHDHPGLNAITGLVGGNTWNLTDNSRNAAAQLENIRSQIMLNAMAALKAASPTGATGLGQLSNAEGETLRNSISSLDRAQSYDEMRHSLENIDKYLTLAKTRAKGALDRTAVGVASSGSALPAATGSARPSLDDPRYNGN